MYAASRGRQNSEGSAPCRSEGCWEEEEEEEVTPAEAAEMLTAQTHKYILTGANC